MERRVATFTYAEEEIIWALYFRNDTQIEETHWANNTSRSAIPETLISNLLKNMRSRLKKSKLNRSMHVTIGLMIWNYKIIRIDLHNSNQL